MKDWVEFILMIISGLCFVGIMVLALFWPDVISTFPNTIQLFLFLNAAWVTVWGALQFFGGKY